MITRICNIFLLAAIASLPLRAQYNFITSGKIQYEKRTNQFKILESSSMDQNMIDQVKKDASKILSERYELLFNNTRSVYKLAGTSEENKYFVMPAPSELALVVKDLAQGQLQLQKDVFANTFTVQDTLNNYEWKILDETRTIAGFECKKADTRVMDSVVVVAFFTTEITPSNGPESFTGLPGMILEIAIPRLYTTWVATKLELKTPTDEELNPALKNKRISNPDFLKSIYKLGEALPPDAKKMLWLFDL